MKNQNIEGRAGRMREHFIGKVYVLESPPVDERYDVEFPIGAQSEEIPLSLLLDLESDDLTDSSRNRIKNAFFQSSLSPETLRKNRHLDIQKQERIADAIKADLKLYGDSLSWKTIPSGTQLATICNLIYEHLESDILMDYGVFSAESLAWHINELRIGSDLTKYIQTRLAGKREEDTPSDIIEATLKLLRNVICHRFPKDLMAIDAIQKDVFTRAGMAPGDYSLFAEQTEHLYIPSILYALDEYGIPIQTASHLSNGLLPAETLDQVLHNLLRLDLAKYDLSLFEVDIIEDVRSSTYV